MSASTAPIGFALSRAARAIAAEFEAFLFQGRGTLSEWLTLLTLARDGEMSQSDLVEAIGVRGPTLTHHLNRMEREGLVLRERRDDNRRAHRVILTDAGKRRFEALRARASAFDARLREAVPEAHMQALREALSALTEAARRANVS